MRRTLFISLLIALPILVSATPSRAGWVEHGTLLCGEAMDQTHPVAIPDGSGGAFVVWRDYRNYIDYDLYAQRIDSWGNPVWFPPEGVEVCTVTGNQEYHRIASDSFGGIVIAWEDRRGGSGSDIYAQRFDGDGNAAWTDDGVAVCNAANDQYLPQITPEATGGAYIVWEDHRNGTDLDIYYQRVLGNGSLYHGSTGAFACTTSYNQTDPVIGPDAANGVIIVWQHGRSGTEWDIYGVRKGPTGNTLWAPNGKALCAATNDQLYPQIAPDGFGGVFVVWADDRGASRDIYAQRFSHDGYELWASDGIPVCTAANAQEYFDIAADSNHDLMIAWKDDRDFPYTDIYAQKLNVLGDTLWSANGTPVCTAANFQEDCAVIPDDAGGAIVCWEDYRYLADADLFAQRLDADGVPVWTADGEPLSVYFYHQFEPEIVTDGEHGALVFWHDFRNAGYYDLYGQRITADGLWGYPCPFIYSVRDVPGDQGGLVNVAWDASRLDVPPGEIDVYTVWRAIDAVAAAVKMKAGAVLVDRPELVEGRFTERALRADGELYWELVETIQAFQLDNYGKPVATLFDSTSVTAEFHHFQVIAHGAAGGLWVSPPESGRSLDNLSPTAPLSLAAERVMQEVELVWNPGGGFDGDFSHYAVYRSATAGFTPGPGNFLTTAPDTVLTDTSAELFNRYYYVVTAFDIHENQSAPSNEAMVDVATGVEDRTPSYDRLTLLPNTPNPFGGSTEIRFGLPVESDVVFEVYDIAGRRVLERRLERMPAGLRTWTFDGRDHSGARLASGVYFYRVTAGGATETRKLVITR